MNIITSPNNSAEQSTLFKQGISFLMEEHGNQISVWTERTPEHEGQRCVAIGACDLSGDQPVVFLKKCVEHLKLEFPNKPIIGPMNGNTWMKHRLIIDSSDQPPFIMEPIEPAELHEQFTEAGFTELSCYSSSRIDLEKPQPQFEKLAALITKQNIHIRELDKENYTADLEQIYDLSISAFSNNFLYTPLPKEAFMASYLSAKDATDPDFVLLAFHDDRLVGFLFCIPNHTPRSLIVKTLATCPQHRTAGLGTYLVAMAQQRAKEKGYTEAIHALQYESNSSLRISQRFNAEKFRTYGLMIQP